MIFTFTTQHFSVQLQGLGWHQLMPAKWQGRDASNMFWTLCHNDRDGAFLQAGKATIPMTAGANYLLPPDCRFDHWCSCEVQHLFMYFNVPGFSPAAVKILFPAPVRLDFSALAQDAFNRIADQSQQEIDLLTQWQCIAALSEGLTHCLEALPPERLEQCQRFLSDVRPVNAALQHIAENLDQSLSNLELAALCSMSKDYFTRRFREHVGQTPTQYVLEARVKRAVQLLLFSDLSIEQVALKAGFGSRDYFSRVFARQIGHGPAAYRKTRRGGRQVERP